MFTTKFSEDSKIFFNKYSSREVKISINDTHQYNSAEEGSVNITFLGEIIENQQNETLIPQIQILMLNSSNPKEI